MTPVLAPPQFACSSLAQEDLKKSEEDHLDVPRYGEPLGEAKNYGMRVIVQVPARTPSSISRTKLKWVTLEQRSALQRLRAVHRCVHETAPGYLQSLFKQQPKTVRTRGQLKLSLKVHNSELYRKSSQHSGARSWNLLPGHIKTTQDYHRRRRKQI